MTRTQKAALLDQLEIDATVIRGKLARVHNRPLGGCLEPKHASEEHRVAFHDGWNAMDRQITEG